MSVQPSPTLKVSEKSSCHEWTLTVRSPAPLAVAALLHDAHRSHFSIHSVTRLPFDVPRSEGIDEQLKDLSINSNRKVILKKEMEALQEWNNPLIKQEMEELGKVAAISSGEVTLSYNVIIKFQSDIYGTFRQALALDFGYEPVLLQRLCVDVIPVDEMQDLDKNKNVVLSEAQRWCNETARIVKFSDDPAAVAEKEGPYNEKDNDILSKYPPPTPNNFSLSEATDDKTVTADNYRRRFHDLLYIEEIAQFNLMGRFNIKTSVLATKSYILTPSTSSMAKVRLILYQ